MVYQRHLPLLIGTIAGLIIIVEYFILPTPGVSEAKAEVTNWGSLAAAFGILVGAVGTLGYHVRRVQISEESLAKITSGFTIGTVIVFIIAGSIFAGYTSAPEYVLIYDHIAAGLARSVRAVAFFSMIIGAYHAFRADSIDALMMFIGGSIYLLRGFAAGVYYFPIVRDIGGWLNTVPNVGATRGAIIALAVGALILTVRVFAGRERAVEEMVAEA
jgi:hypothetical protein